MSIRYSVLVLATTAACHNDSHSPPPPDTPIDVTHTVTINRDDTTYLYLAVRDGNGPWTKLDPTAASIEVHDDYQVIAACGDATNGFETIIQSATVADGNTVGLPCFAFATTPTITATGTMVQAGSVAIGLAQSSTTANWPFSFTVSTGAHALLAIGGGKAIARRGLDFEADTTLPDVDTSGGTTLSSTTFTLHNVAAGATTKSRLTAFIQPDFMFMPSTPGTTIQPLPASLLQTGDFQDLGVSAVTPTGIQIASVDPAKTSVTTIELLPALTGVTFTNGQVAWSSALPVGDVELDSLVIDTLASFTHIQGTASWIAAKTSLAIDTTGIPGFMPEWLADTTVANLSFSVSTNVGSVFLATEALPPATSVAPAARSFREHRRSLDRLRGR